MKRQRTKAARRDVITTVALPQIMIDAIDRQAEEEQIFSRSAIVRRAVQEYLDRRTTKLCHHIKDGH